MSQHRDAVNDEWVRTGRCPRCCFIRDERAVYLSTAQSKHCLSIIWEKAEPDFIEIGLLSRVAFVPDEPNPILVDFGHSKRSGTNRK